MQAKSTPRMGVGDDWEFDYPLEAVKLGWLVKKMTGRIMPFEELAKLDPRWVSDLSLMDEISEWVTSRKGSDDD